MSMGKRIAIMWITAAIVAVAGAWAVQEWVYGVARMDGVSMEPTIQANEVIRINKMATEFERGDVIKFLPMGGRLPLVRRIIALEGEEIFIDYDTDRVLINGSTLNEPHRAAERMGYVRGFASEIPFEVPAGTFFVMGDNRNASWDSRTFGAVVAGTIIGRVDLRD